MPAGYGKICDACYWSKSCRKRIAMDLAAFSNLGLRDAFSEFGWWLESEVGAHKAALTVHRYLPFFTEIESRWKRVPEYPVLLEQFGAEALRRVRLPMRWLRETRGVEPDPEAREADSERRRIEALGATIPARSLAAKVFADYQRMLTSKLEAGRTSLRSVRLALHPAASLCLQADPTGCDLPNQQAVDRYLLAAPGQRAAVTGFVRFLSTRGVPKLVACVDRKKTQRTRRRALEKEIMRMAKHPEEGHLFEQRWVAIGLEYFHGIGVSKRRLQAATVTKSGGGLQVELDGKSYSLPKCGVQRDG